MQLLKIIATVINLAFSFVFFGYLAYLFHTSCKFMRNTRHVSRKVNARDMFANCVTLKKKKKNLFKNLME